MGRNKLVERFIAAFRTTSSNRSTYEERRPEIADALDAVKRVLDARGTGFLPIGSLGEHELSYQRLSDELERLDQLAKTDPAEALGDLTELEDPSSELRANILVARKSAEKAESVRRNLLAQYEFYEARARLDLVTVVEYLGGPSPAGLHDQLTEIEKQKAGDLAGAVAKLQTVGEALAQLANVAEALRALAIPDDLPKERAEGVVEAKASAVRALIDARPEAAWDAYGELEGLLKSGARAKQAKQEISGVQPEDLYARLKLRLDDVLDYPADYASEAVVELQTAVRKAKIAYEAAAEPRAKLAAFLEKHDVEVDAAPPRLRLEAGLSLPGLQKAVEALAARLQEAAGPLRAHDAEVRRYYKRLKELKPRLTMAAALPLQVSGIDAAWKTEKEAYTLAHAAVKAEVDPPKRDYKAGNLALDDLVLKLDALAKKRVEALDAEIDTATTGANGGANKARALVDQLSTTPGLIAEMKPAQQLKLLESLRTKIVTCTSCDISMTAREFTDAGFQCTSCGSDADIDAPVRCSNDNCCRTRRVQSSGPCPDCGLTGITWALEMEPSFTTDPGGVVKRHPNRPLLEARAKILGNMKMDPGFVEFDKGVRKKIVTAVRDDKNFSTAASEWATWVKDGDTGKMETFLNSVLAKQWAVLAPDQKGLKRTKGGMEHDFPDFPVKVKFFRDRPSLFGQCSPGFPTWIEINLDGSYIADFKEQVDTIIHENMHAFQEMLIAGIQKRAPFTDGAKQTEILNNPQLATQAKMFAENDESYINSGTLDYSLNARILSQRTYRHEPLEEHAWTAGGKSSQALLVPPQVRSFQSKRGLKNKIWFIESIQRANQPEVRLRERHGIYGDEWEGERATDKVLILENVKKNHALVSLNAKIVEVVNEYTLKLNVDLRAYDPLVTITGNRKDGFTETPDNSFVAVETARLILDETVSNL